MIKWLCLSVIFLVSCQTKPTKVFESIETKVKSGQAAEVPKDVVIVDARPAFEYSISHINGSVNVRWDEFTQPQEPFRGLFETDLFFHARRLSRLGIGPETPVIVVGRGPQGQGEEGRVAWTLRYLGLKNVRFMHVDAFDRPNTREEAPPRANLPIWKPEFETSLIVDRATVLTKMLIPKDQPEAPVIIDVRPEAEYLGKVPSVLPQRPPDIGAINVPWTEFITSQGIVVTDIREKLLQVGVSPERTVICISNRGVESATVTLALRELGYTKATNYAGGFADLIAERKPTKKSVK